MRFELEVFTCVLADQGLQFFKHDVRFGLAALGEDILVVHDLRADVVFVDDLAHVLKGGLGRRNRCAHPALESIAESVEVRVRAHSWVLVGLRGAAKGILRFEDQVALVRALLLQIIGRRSPRR